MVALSEGGEMRLLLVDDQPIVLSSLEYLLNSVGVTAVGFDDPVMALETFRGSPQNFDAIITDLAMPGMSGIELANRVWADHPDFPITILSGFLDEAQTDSVSESKAVRFLAKPAELAEILAALRDCGLDVPPVAEPGADH